MITVGFTLHVDRSLTDRLLILSARSTACGTQKGWRFNGAQPQQLLHAALSPLPGPSREGDAGRAAGPVLHRAKV